MGGEGTTPLLCAVYLAAVGPAPGSRLNILPGVRRGVGLRVSAVQGPWVSRLYSLERFFHEAPLSAVPYPKP
jgi:hypothetical protein